MLSSRLLVYCVLASGLYLLIISVLLRYVGHRLRVTEGIKPELLESTGLTWSFIHFLIEAVFFVSIPTITYGFFYLLIPLSGAKAGLAAALFAFTLGAAPVLMGLSVRVKLPMPFLLFTLLSHLLKLAGCMAIIGYLYSL
ncbi:MAG: hypothetical protein JSU65_10790 [Candidatus Zixiibacteriota bacterium]|nr:MAG: hypothetical protein JSU65_10790 [candidate division Zixibacteria bacterium]